MLDSWVNDQATAGIRANGSKEFTVKCDGRTWYEILHVLEQEAIKADSYTVVRHCVLLQDELFEQLKRQGF